MVKMNKFGVLLILLIFTVLLANPVSAQILVRQPDGSYKPITFSDIGRTLVYWKNGTIYEKLGLEDLEVEDYHIYVKSYKLNFSQIGTIDDLAKELNDNRSLDELVLFTNKQNVEIISSVIDSSFLSVDKVVNVIMVNSTNITKVFISFYDVSSNKIQNVMYTMADNVSTYYRLIELITCTADNVTLQSSETYYNVSIFNYLYLNGKIYYADGQPHVIISNVIESGTVSKTATGGTGGNSPTSGGNGGSGGGGLILVAREIKSVTINANGGNGQNGWPNIYVSDGTGGSGGNGYLIGVSGDSIGGDGGDGGDDTHDNVHGGSGGIATVDLYTDYSLFSSNIIKAACDWVIVHVLNKSLSSYMQFPNIYGSGGGGGGVGQYCAGGGGGGQGGEVIIVSTKVQCTINAKGGNGGNAAVAPAAEGGGWATATGGDGGDGGVIYVMYIYSASVSSNVSGGSGGNGVEGGSAGSSGQNGLVKVVQIG